MYRLILFFILQALLPFLGLAQLATTQDCAHVENTLYGLDITESPKTSIDTIHQLMLSLASKACPETKAACEAGLSAAYYYNRDYIHAKQHAEAAFELSKSCCPNSEVHASALTNLVTFLSGPRVIELKKEALRIEENYGSDLRSMAYSLEDLGLSYQQHGDYATAINYFQLSREKIRAFFKKDSHEEARLLQQIGDCQKNNGDYELALTNNLACLEILQKFPQTKFYNQTRWYANRGMAELYLLLNQPEKAKGFIFKAIALQKNENLLEAYRSRLTLGDIYLAQQNHSQALKSYQYALDRSQTEFAIYNQHVALARPEAKMAEVMLAKKEYPQALEHYQRALSYLAIHFSKDSLLENPTADQLINQYEAIKIMQGKASCLAALAQLKEDKTFLIAAEKSMQLGAQLIQSVRQSYLAQGSKHTLIDDFHSFYEQAIDLALKIFELTEEEQYLEAAFYYAENNKAVLLAEEKKNKAAKNRADIPDSLLQIEQTLVDDINFLRRNILEEKQKKETAQTHELSNWEKELQLARKALENCVQTLESTFPRYAAEKKQAIAPSVALVQKEAMGDNKALIEFVLGKNSGYVFSITKNTFRYDRIEDIPHLEEAIQRILDGITRAPKDSESYQSDYDNFIQLSHEIYQKLLGKIIAQLDTEVDGLVIIPDGILNYLPFEILLTETVPHQSPNFSSKQLPYLLERYNISYNYSASNAIDQKTTSQRELPKHNFVGFAPSFGENAISAIRDCSGASLSSLMCNAQEVKAVNALVGGEIYLGAQASRLAFEEGLGQHKVVHFATHACINESEQALNKIFFANEEYITQSELNGLALPAQLTVLSACNTANGQLKIGEGVMSLARCFMIAGSKSVLTSLWSVDDCATTTIMTAFYENLSQGQPKDAAIRDAKLTFLEQADLNTSHPYYWASFVQFGSAEPIAFDRQNKRYWLFAVLGFAAVIFLLLGYAKRKSIA